MTGLVPEPFASQVSGYPADAVEPGASYAVAGDVWVRALPRLLADLLDEWALTPDGATRWGVCAVVVPVTGPEGPAALKATWPHLEARDEHLALRAWSGLGAVRLLRADPRRFALLLERLDAARDLSATPVDEACAVIGDLLAQLSRPALLQTPSLSGYVARQLATDVGGTPGRHPTLPPRATDVLPRRFLDQGRRLAADLVADPDVDADLLHTDLHFANVLGSDRQPWLALDPKPMAGDRAFEVAPALWNRADELGSGSALRWSLRRRVDIVCEHAGIDVDRARAWTIVREVDNALQEPPGSARASLAVAVIKAMND